jgi:hypothetical protein
MTAPPVMPVLFGGLIAWGIYRRIRRNIGRQKLQPRRILFSIVIFSLVSVIFIGMSLLQMHLMLGIVGGLALGVSLGFLGLRLTRFETNDEGHFYTPNTHIGVALSLLFVGRLLYRFWVLRDVETASGHPPPFQSPLTFFIFGLIAGYYIVYYVGLFVHTHDKK